MVEITQISINWIKEMWSIHTRDYYLALQRNKILIHIPMWITLETIMLSERSQMQKTAYYMIYFRLNVQNRELYRDRNLINGCWGGDGRFGGLGWLRLLKSMGFFFFFEVMKTF